MLYLKRMWRRRIRVPRFRTMPSGNRKPRIKLFLVLGIFLILCLILYNRLTPIVSSMAVAASKNAVTRAINNAISARVSEGDLDYKDIVTLEKDVNGNVTALITDMSKINAMKSEISYDIIKSITDEKTTKVAIPFGNLVGGSLFSGMGPDIPVRIVAISAVTTNFSNNFSSSGINQTRHQIIVDVSVMIKVLVPGKIEKTEVQTQVAVAETIIVGHVPESYTYFEGSEQWDTNTEKFDITT